MIVPPIAIDQFTLLKQAFQSRYGRASKPWAQLLFDLRTLVCGAQQMLGNNATVLRVDQCAFMRSSKKIVRMSHQILIERIILCNHYR